MSTPEPANLQPCVPWITGEDLVDCGISTATGADLEAILDNAAEVASDVLYQLSGHRFPGECDRTVRPCECITCPPRDVCGCCHLSTVKLAGYVRAVTEVKIDGVAISPSEYRVDKHKYLVYLADTDGNRQTWPGCQRLDLEDTEEDTFSVAYTYGLDPPKAGFDAAVELGCEIASSATGGECALPAGVTKVTRQGITIEIGQALQAGLAMLPLTSLFLSAYNPGNLRRRAAVWSPDLQPFAQEVG